MSSGTRTWLSQNGPRGETGTKYFFVNQIKEDRAKECAHREAMWQQIARDKAEREAR